jgi:arginase
MPLRMLLDGGHVRAEDVALVGARDLDPGELAFIAESRLATGTNGIEPALAGADRVYVALDCDVLDPGEGVDVFMPVPEGLSLTALETVLRDVADRLPLAGAGLTGLVVSDENGPALERLCAALGLR